jgi:hypothetical protein
MGDRVEIEKVQFIYGHLWQIDLYNETKKEKYRVFVEEKDLEKILKEAKENANG